MENHGFLIRLGDCACCLLRFFFSKCMFVCFTVTSREKLRYAVFGLCLMSRAWVYLSHIGPTLIVEWFLCISLEINLSGTGQDQHAGWNVCSDWLNQFVKTKGGSWATDFTSGCHNLMSYFFRKYSSLTLVILLHYKMRLVQVRDEQETFFFFFSPSCWAPRVLSTPLSVVCFYHCWRTQHKVISVPSPYIVLKTILGWENLYWSITSSKNFILAEVRRCIHSFLYQHLKIEVWEPEAWYQSLYWSSKCMLSYYRCLLQRFVLEDNYLKAIPFKYSRKISLRTVGLCCYLPREKKYLSVWKLWCQLFWFYQETCDIRVFF